jgi:hypothetical protein
MWDLHYTFREGVEEAFKRLKRRMDLESVSGLSQHALLIDVAAKVLADNIASLLCNATQPDAEVNAIEPSRAHRTHAAAVIQRLLPKVLLCVGNVIALIDDALLLIARMRQRVARGRGAPRPARYVKPHPRLAYKGAGA